MKMTFGIFMIIGGLGLAIAGVFTVMGAQSKPELADSPLEEKEIETPVVQTSQDSLQEEEKEVDYYLMGLEFEEYIVPLFDKKYFKLIDWRGDKKAANGAIAESNMYPDIEFSLKKGGKDYKFAIECKYRSKKENVIEWSKPDQIERYRNFSKEKDIPVFLVIGVGGTPKNPEFLNVIPLDELKSEFVSVHQLKKHNKKVGSNFYYDVEKGVLR